MAELKIISMDEVPVEEVELLDPDNPAFQFCRHQPYAMLSWNYFSQNQFLPATM